tara:strand:+ start:1331 stop:2149 length:819 start_codon:yes stop_codon:yes gene_type:complete
MNQPMDSASPYGADWIKALTDNAARWADTPASLYVADTTLAKQAGTFIAVVPDPDSRYPRARAGEVGLVEGWGLAHVLCDIVAADAQTSSKRAIVAVVDVPSQAYGRTEEAYGIHQALAAAAQGYIRARRAGHPVVTLIAGKAMSGGFLAHGYQANRIVSLSGTDVQVHAMGKHAAARITQRSVEGVEQLARQITPMAYDIDSYERLGLLHARLDVAPEAAGDSAAVARVRDALAEAAADIGGGVDLGSRIGRGERTATARVRERMAAEWPG